MLKKLSVLLSLGLFLSPLKALSAPHPYKLGRLLPRRTDPSRDLIYQGVSTYNYFASLAGKVNSQGLSYCFCKLRLNFALTPTWERWPHLPSEIGVIAEAKLVFKNGQCVVSHQTVYSSDLRYWVDYIFERVEARNNDLNNTWYPYYADVKHWNFRGNIGSSYSYGELLSKGCLEAPENDPPTNNCPNMIIRGLPFIRNTITCHSKIGDEII